MATEDRFHEKIKEQWFRRNKGVKGTQTERERE